MTGAGFPGHGPAAAIVTTVTEAGTTSAAARGGCHETIASAMITLIPPPAS